jgi:hypothetical protein
VPIVVKVDPSGEASKFTVPSLTLWLIVAVMVTELPAAWAFGGDTLVIVVVLAGSAHAGAANRTPTPETNKTVETLIAKPRSIE